MSLTKDDLQAIKGIVENVAEEIKIDVAAGFTEVHEKIDAVHQELDEEIEKVSDKLDVKDSKLEDTVERVDRHQIEIKQMKQKLA